MKQFVACIAILGFGLSFSSASLADDSFQSGDPTYEVLVFWASWCGARDTVLKDMGELQARGAMSGATIRAVNLGDASHAAEALKRKGGHSLQLVAEGQPLADRLHVTQVPWVVVVDSAGRPVFEPSRSAPPKYVAQHIQMDLALRL